MNHSCYNILHFQKRGFMKNLEILKLSAKAMGLKVIDYTNDYDGRDGVILCDEFGRHTRSWDPINNDEDSFRLAMHLQIDIIHDVLSTDASVDSINCGSKKEYGVEEAEWVEEAVDGNVLKASRLAIARAAANIGALMS